MANRTESFEVEYDLLFEYVVQELCIRDSHVEQIVRIKCSPSYSPLTPQFAPETNWLHTTAQTGEN